MFHIQPASVDESVRPGEAPGDYVLRLAEAKARICAASGHPGQTILAADTAVVIEDTILGKPNGMDEAITMLTRLRGRTHQVCTAIAVLRMADDKLLTELCITDVPMRDYSEAELLAYVASGDPLDKAGAYAIQHPGFHPVSDLQGCFASVMGLPLCHLVRALRQLDVAPNADVPASCQVHLRYQCPISHRVLRGEQVG